MEYHWISHNSWWSMMKSHLPEPPFKATRWRPEQAPLPSAAAMDWRASVKTKTAILIGWWVEPENHRPPLVVSTAKIGSTIPWWSTIGLLSSKWEIPLLDFVASIAILVGWTDHSMRSCIMAIQNGNSRLTRNLVFKLLPPWMGSIREGFPRVDRWSSFSRFLDRCHLNPWIQQEQGQSKSWELLTVSVGAVSGLALPTKEMIEQERSLHGWRLCLPFP